MKYGRHKADAIISKPISYFCLRWEQTTFSAAVSLFYHKQPKQVSILAKWVFIFKNISQKVPRKHNKMRVRRCNDSWTPYLYIRQNFNRQLMNWAGFFFSFLKFTKCDCCRVCFSFNCSRVIGTKGLSVYFIFLFWWLKRSIIIQTFSSL